MNEEKETASGIVVDASADSQIETSAADTTTPIPVTTDDPKPDVEVDDGFEFKIKEDLRFGGNTVQSVFNNNFQNQIRKEERLKNKKKRRRLLTDALSGQKNFQGTMFMAILIFLSQITSFILKFGSIIASCIVIYCLILYVMDQSLVGVVCATLAIFILVWFHERIG